MNADPATLAPPGRAPGRWSSRPFAEADQNAVLDLFTAPDFFFRDPHPATLAEHDLRALLAGTQVIEAGGAPVGVYTVEPVGASHGCHYELHFRLRADQPDSSWQLAYREIIRALRHRAEVVRVTVQAAEFDHRMVRVLRGLGLTEEGVLAGVVLHRGQRYGYHFFSEIWMP